MTERISVRQWITKYVAGEFKDIDINTQITAGWFDWFCKDQSLARRLTKMGNIIKKISNPVILDNYYVWFKNNSPCVGPLYDDMRFQPLQENCKNAYFGVSFTKDDYGKTVYNFFTERNSYLDKANFYTSKELVAAIDKYGEEMKDVFQFEKKDIEEIKKFG